MRKITIFVAVSLAISLCLAERNDNDPGLMRGGAVYKPEIRVGVNFGVKRAQMRHPNAIWKRHLDWNPPPFYGGDYDEYII